MRRLSFATLMLPLLGVAAACVPADEALGLGSVQFTFKASQRTREGIIADETEDGYALRFDRVILGLKTMTIGKIGATDVCSYRGRGARTDVVFDPRLGVVQSFNGIQPVECPDVGVIFGSPGGATTLGDGATSGDMVELANGRPAHAIVEATATRSFGGTESDRRPYQIKLRFDTELTSTRFGGCRAAARGVRILAGTRDDVIVRFAAENLFRDAISTTSGFRVCPFVRADRNADHIITMDELDVLPLTAFYCGDGYQLAGGTGSGSFDGSQLAGGTGSGSFGDYVRSLFRFTVMFRTEEGICVGNEPGAEEDGKPNE